MPRENRTYPKQSGKNKRKCGVRKCGKEGCEEELKDHQISRCSKHLMKCFHKDCMDVYVLDTGGFCIDHFLEKKKKLN